MPQARKSTEIRKKEIIEAARKLIYKKGSEHVTVNNIAKEVKISEAAIYRHFRNKKEILSFLARHITESLVQDIDSAARSALSSPDNIGGILRSHLSKIEQKRGVSFQVIAEIISFGDKKLNKQVYDDIQNYLQRFRELLDNGIKAGLIREDIDSEATALLLFVMIQGLVNTWALSNYSFDLTERYDTLWDIFRRMVIRH
ncbi:MAG: TetR/AcrR family transcriptional regulator [Proteobacteria bacterium]|nr:TetR/AcrR family transcriptional regulator [Pseudomonadota bacterium]MBU1571423.1 TetR/AcrR family transcriptional regulator [Pseudomonadota bacterium]